MLAQRPTQQRAPLSELGVDRGHELPVGVQLAWKLRGMIARGRLGSGERLPSVRGLAEAAGVNVNTARSVYGQLESEGLIASRQGLGTFVTERPAAAAELQRIATTAVAEAREAGLDPGVLAPAVYAEGAIEPASATEPPASVSSTHLPDVATESDQRGVRRELRRQIERLEAELAAYAREVPKPEPQHPLLAPKAHVAGVGELEAIRNGLLDQLAEARRRAEGKGRRERRARAHREEMARDPKGHKWEWVSNEEAGEPACGTWHVTPQYGPLGALMGWWRVKVSSGCPLAGAG